MPRHWLQVNGPPGPSGEPPRSSSSSDGLPSDPPLASGRTVDKEIHNKHNYIIDLFERRLKTIVSGRLRPQHRTNPKATAATINKVYVHLFSLIKNTISRTFRSASGSAGVGKLV